MATFSVTSSISNGARNIQKADDAQPFPQTTPEPAIQYIEKEVQVVVEKIVEVKVEVEKIVEKPIEIIKEVRVEVPIIQERIVEVIREVPTTIEKEVQVFVDRVIETPVKHVYTTVKQIPNSIWYVVAMESLIIVLMAHYLFK
jgi:hypothetical protein